MSEYIIGDRIEAAEQPYTLTEREFTEAVGIRVYGTEGGTGEKMSEADTEYYVLMTLSDTQRQFPDAPLKIGDAPIYTGYADVFVITGGYGYTQPIKEALSPLAGDPDTPVLNITKFNHTKYPFSFIYEGGTHMTTVTERIANITIDSTEEVTFKPAYPFYAVKGESIKATLIADIADDATQGVYSTDNGNGYTIIKNPKMETTLYLTGTGDVSVWGGENPEACPFV